MSFVCDARDHHYIAEVAEKAASFEAAQQLGGKRWLEPGGAAELDDCQEAIALDEVEPDKGILGEGQTRGGWPAPAAPAGVERSNGLLVSADGTLSPPLD